MGSQFSVTNDTVNDMYCVQSNDKDAVDLFLKITEWMGKIGGLAIPGLGSWNSYVTTASTSLLKLSGLSPKVVMAIMKLSGTALSVGPAVTSYVVNYTIQKAKDQGFQVVKAGKTFRSSLGTLSLRQALTCITVNQVLDLRSNFMFVKTNEIYMGNLYTGGTIDLVNSYKVSDYLWNSKEVSSVEIEPPFGYDSWKNLDMNYDQTSKTFTNKIPIFCNNTNIKDERPLQSCLNNLVWVCDPKNTFYRPCECSRQISYYGTNLNINWKTYFTSCYSDFGGLYPSRKCTVASQTLRKHEWFYDNSGKIFGADYGLADSAEYFIFQNPGCVAAYTCKKESGTGQPWDTCLSGLMDACQSDSLAGSPCECKKKIMAVRDQLNPTWKKYFNQCAHSEIGKQMNCYDAKDAVMKNELVITNMKTETTKPNECGINGTSSTVTFAPASAFISVSQTENMLDYVTGCNF